MKFTAEELVYILDVFESLQSEENDEEHSRIEQKIRNMINRYHGH
jgi:hypothetical protein